MATKRTLPPRTKTSENELVEAGIQLITMGIREEMMTYFKGTCVDRLAGNSNVFLQPHTQGGRYFFQRREQEIEYPCIIRYGNIRFGMVRRQPDTAAFYPGVMTRSPEFMRIYEGVQDFFHKYLQGVQLTEDTDNSHNSKTDGSADRGLLMEAGVNSQVSFSVYSEPVPVRPFESSGFVTIDGNDMQAFYAAGPRPTLSVEEMRRLMTEMGIGGQRGA